MDTVFARIHELTLPLQPDRNTLGGGNCFFHALIQQGKRDGVLVKGGNHQWLRERVCEFALSSSNFTVTTMRENFNCNAIDVSWDMFWSKMKRKGVFVEGPVAEVTAQFLGINIIVVSPLNNVNNPWLEISGGEGADSHPPILLANLQGCHYQSMLPIEGLEGFYQKTKLKSKVQDSLATSADDSLATSAKDSFETSAKLAPTKVQNSPNQLARVDPYHGADDVVLEVEEFVTTQEPQVQDSDQNVELTEAVTRHNELLGRMVRHGIQNHIIQDIMLCFRSDEAIMQRCNNVSSSITLPEVYFDEEMDKSMSLYEVSDL